MDPQVEDRQQEEITALQSIYDKDFAVREAKAWKSAQRLAEFNIRVTHPQDEHAEHIFFSLHTIFPKTYPVLACPIFKVEQANGLTKAQVAKLEHAIQQEAQKYKGQEMVFQIVTFAQEWMNDHVKPPREVSGSLAAQMNRRAVEQEKARKQREEEEAALQQQRAAELAEQLNEQIRENAYQQQQERERMQQLARKRAMSDATTVGPSEDTLVESEGEIETFDREILWKNAAFSRVRLFHSRQEGLGTLYQAEPIVEKSFETIALELLSVTFMSDHYKRPQGLKKLKELESDIQRLTTIRHHNLLAVLAVKLVIPRAPDNPRLVILTEQRPSVTLYDVLEDTDHIREERATDYLGQILAAMNTLHAAGIMHKGPFQFCIGLAPRDNYGPNKLIKIFNVCYHVCLLALHRSNNIGFAGDSHLDDMQVPEGWMPQDTAESTLVFTKGRDIHAVGIVLVQMIMGRDVMDKFPDPQSALHSTSVSPFLQQKAAIMLSTTRKNSVSAQTLLGDLITPSVQPASNVRTPTIPFSGPKTPMVNGFFAGSPETDYFRMPPPKPKHASRWKEDWEELEILGRGGYGEVVKARNKIDGRIYAVKRIKLRNVQNDKIFREVNALSRLNHRFIVRYYTTWVETTEDAPSTANSDIDSSVSDTTDGMTSVPQHSDRSESEDHITTFDMNDLDSPSKHSFPSIHFGSRSGDDIGSDSTSESSEIFADEIFATPARPRPIPNSNNNGTVGRHVTPSPKPAARILYIQMEYVERQTLKERINEGLDEQNAWRLFHQILDALVHMSSLGILHRDIKLTNIFIDGKGDCKVGDFGLATSSLAAVDPSDVAPSVARHEDMTLDVGTALYIAPELQSRRKGPRNSAKADMYSLGIVFFEMNYFFKTESERWSVLLGLRNSDVTFPSDWDPRRARQQQIIRWLLEHDPEKRPTALELSQSPLLPPRLEDEYVKSAMKLIAKPDSPHLQAVLSTLFSHPVKNIRTYLYDADAGPPEHSSLNTLVIDRLSQLFRLHGAIDVEPPLLMPVTNPKDDRSRALFLDRHGEVVTLPNNALVPFARAAARAELKRIKRYHISDVYHPNVIAGHPRASKVAVFDIITPDLITGPTAATSEAISIVSECLDTFGNLWQHYEIHLSHSRILDKALEHVPPEIRADTIEILSQSKSSTPQKRSNLLRKGVTRAVNDWLEVLSETYETVDAFAERLDRSYPQLRELVDEYIQDMKTTVQFAIASGVTRPMKVNPLMLQNRSSYYSDGVCFEVVRKNKYSDVLATGGRYDHLIGLYAPPKSELNCAVAVQIHLEKITAALAAYQSACLRTLLKEQKSFGYWSPRRCDVYVVSYQPGYLTERLEIAATLWKHGISADVMYEASLRGMVESENYVDQCSREGILFIVHAKPRIGSALVYKVKSVLRGTETEVLPNELVPFLQQQIAEQKRVDAATSGAAVIENGQPQPLAKEQSSSTGEVLMVLPGDVKKQRKGTKTVLLNKAYDHAVAVKNALPRTRTIAIDVPTPVFEEMAKNSDWLNNDEVLRAIATGLPAQYGHYAQQVKEAVNRQKTDGNYVLLYGIRQERIVLLTLT
ncbi:Serine/threonine-protein kinase [Trametes polyzona]|nr:Serine/threonine-protein kinase [Trametes polyzona]